ncbi:hypothetical protein C3737_21315 [Aeromonas jandaei]|uniref:hypothetical protein n=1 Tax=Aeromonas TaxID=642 RepID=UPI000CCFACC4|nr:MULTISPECIES: hypothetical protein [Aeromonas]PNW66896.1 hypothetical protein C2U29_13720 [Aeromonas veronii]PPA28060.1 hypothetical protein C3737_21315 [Aeromonas jandaei]
MDSSKLYEADFPTQHKVQDIDIVTLYHGERFDELDSVIVCKSREGIITATFGQNTWDCFPFSRKKSYNDLNFEEFNSTPELQREMKLLVFGWLFNKSPKQRKGLKFSSIHALLVSLKRSYRFLAKKDKHSLAQLSNTYVWADFETYLTTKVSKKSSLIKTFGALNAAIDYSSWHKLNLGLEPIKSTEVSDRLESTETQQTLVIPERLCNAIYGKAIELVEGAYPHRQLIADIEKSLQENYISAKHRVDEKVKAGTVFSFMSLDGSIDNHKYSLAIKDHHPQKPRNIIAPLANKLPNIPLKNGCNFGRYLGQLSTASYIICGGFSGMRDSELNKLTPDSYYKDTLDGRDYHMLQSHTFKLGEKRATWVTAASSKLAIELMTTLTEHWRTAVSYPDENYANSLWVKQQHRSKAPTLIDSWSHRLQLFCKQFDFTVNESDYQECVESNPRSLMLVMENVKVGQPWPLAPHQFRRTLAFYCIKNRLSTLVALKQQFKHLYLAMTEWYTNGGKLASLRDLTVDENVRKILNDISTETTANKIFKQWHSDETLSGSYGKTIMKMRGDVPTIYGSWEVIYKAVKEGKLTLHGSMHSYCKSGYDCDMDGVVTPQFCVDCGSGSSIIDKEQAKWWQKKHSSLMAYMVSGDDISVTDHSHYITQIRAAEKVMSDFGLTFTPFEPELKVTTE